MINTTRTVFFHPSSPSNPPSTPPKVSDSTPLVEKYLNDRGGKGKIVGKRAIGITPVIKLVAPNGETSTDSNAKFPTGNPNEKGDTMALQMIKRSTLPVSHGVAGKPSVGIRGNGQLAFSTSATKALAGCTLAAIGWTDAAKRTMGIQGFSKCPQKVSPDDLFKISVSEKNKSSFISCAPLLTAVEYDYKASGNQTFPATVDEGTHLITFSIPKGALKPIPIKPRTKKDKGVETAARANGAAVAAATAPKGEDQEGEGEELQEEAPELA